MFTIDKRTASICLCLSLLLRLGGQSGIPAQASLSVAAALSGDALLFIFGIAMSRPAIGTIRLSRETSSYFNTNLVKRLQRWLSFSNSSKMW